MGRLTFVAYPLIFCIHLSFQCQITFSIVIVSTDTSCVTLPFFPVFLKYLIFFFCHIVLLYYVFLKCLLKLKVTSVRTLLHCNFLFINFLPDCRCILLCPCLSSSSNSGVFSSSVDASIKTDQEFLLKSSSDTSLTPTPPQRVGPQPRTSLWPDVFQQSHIFFLFFFSITLECNSQVFDQML